MFDLLLKNGLDLSVSHERGTYATGETYELYNAMLFKNRRMKYSAVGDTAQEAINEVVELASRMEGLIEDEKQ